MVIKLEKKIKSFIIEDNIKSKYSKKNLLIIKFKEKDMNKVDDIYYLVKDLKTNFSNNNKIILFLIYISKVNDKNIGNNIGYILGANQIFINNLKNQNKNFLNLLKSSNIDIIKNQLIDLNQIIKNNIDTILRFFHYNIINSNKPKSLILVFFFPKINV